MASPPVQSTEISILTPDYMALLHSMCTITKPSLNDVTAIFKEFRRSLDARKPKPSPKPSKSSPSSSGTSEKRGRKSATRASAASDDAGGDDCGIAHTSVGFERSCTWEPDEKRCWIMSDMELWNRILAHDCIELRQFTWCELALMGYHWPEKKTGDQDILRASLLIHVLLRQHRCVTYIYLDLAYTALEKHVLWHALKTGAMGVKRLEYRQNFMDMICAMPLSESTTCCEAIASMTNVTFLQISGMCFTREVVRIIGSYVEQATSLTHLELLNILVVDTNTGRFLDHLARNRSLKYLHVHKNFLLARKGRALADAVLNHVTLEELKVKGSRRHSPSALLAAAAHSRSLQSLILLGSFIDPADIEAMASALAIPSQPPDFYAEVIPPPPVSRLRKLFFRNCRPSFSQLQAAYATLIGGVLVELELSQCGLGEVFASRAAERLLHDRRLRILNVENNDFSVNSIKSMVEVLQANKTLKALVLNMTTKHSQEDVSSLFDMVSRINAFSRLLLHWVYPRASDFPKSALMASTPSVSMILDDYEAEDAAGALDTIASSCNLDMATIQCSANVKKAVIQRLADTLASTKSLQHLVLSMAFFPDADVFNVFRALESNRTIFIMVFNAITFGERNAKALGRLVERNRTFNSLILDLNHSEPCVDRMVQFRNICRELKEALRRNRFIAHININLGNSDLSNDPAIKEAIRRNSALINQAIRFVNGSMDKTDALAFETLQHCRSVSIRMHSHGGISLESALQKVAEARERLALNYFVLAGVVKAKLVCQMTRKEEKKMTLLDKIGRVMQARICSYLSLTDVVDI